MMRLLPGVRVYGWRPELLVAIVVAAGVFEKHGVDLIATCGANGTHGSNPPSLHYAGAGVDFRTNHMSPIQRVEVVEALKAALGYPDSEFDVVLEADHLHVEYQPKRGMNL